MDAKKGEREGQNESILMEETNMLDYSNTHIQSLIQKKGWRKLAEFDRIRAIYDYVRDDILFGYNIDM